MVAWWLMRDCTGVRSVDLGDGCSLVRRNSDPGSEAPVLAVSPRKELTKSAPN